MYLKDGGLYETKHGNRFRVSAEDGIFVCRSFGGFWYYDGEAAGKVMIDGKYRRPHLVREVVEQRWVPATREDFRESRGMRIIISNGRHYQRRVSLEEAKQIGQEGHDKAMLKRVATVAQPPVSAYAAKIPEKGEGNIRLKDKGGFSIGFTWEISYDGKHSVLDIETTSGGKATFCL